MLAAAHTAPLNDTARLVAGPDLADAILGQAVR
jgi:hypothetical protein